jgi:hypothetical protein
MSRVWLASARCPGLAEPLGRTVKPCRGRGTRGRGSREPPAAFASCGPSRLHQLRSKRRPMPAWRRRSGVVVRVVADQVGAACPSTARAVVRCRGRCVDGQPWFPARRGSGSQGALAVLAGLIPAARRYVGATVDLSAGLPRARLAGGASTPGSFNRVWSVLSLSWCRGNHRHRARRADTTRERDGIAGRSAPR